MLADLHASDDQIADLLGIKPSTLATYRRQGWAPRPVMLALFWETRWGRSAADTEAANYGARNAQHARSLQRELARLAGVVLAMEKELNSATPYEAANGPVWRVG